MSRLWEVAPPATWALLTLASICLLTGFILLSHTLVRRKARRERWRGWTAPGTLGWTIRGGGGFLLAGLALWAWTLDAAAWVLAGLVAPALLAAGLQATAVVRGRNGSRP